MKNNRIQYEQYLKNVYRKDNGESLKPETIRDYSCLCNKTGEYLGKNTGYIFQINSSSTIRNFMPEIKQLSEVRYKNPSRLVQPVKAYMSYLEFENNKQAERDLISATHFEKN